MPQRRRKGRQAISGRRILWTKMGSHLSNSWSSWRSCRRNPSRRLGAAAKSPRQSAPRRIRRAAKLAWRVGSLSDDMHTAAFGTGSPQRRIAAANSHPSNHAAAMGVNDLGGKEPAFCGGNPKEGLPLCGDFDLQVAGARYPRCQYALKTLEKRCRSGPVSFCGRNP